MRSLAANELGELWIVRSDYRDVFFFNNMTGIWTDMGLKNVDYIAAGTTDQIYALAEPKTGKDYTIYALNEGKWIPLPGLGGTRIAVG